MMELENHQLAISVKKTKTKAKTEEDSTHQ